ncbi:MAG TPA: hypothetical protein VF545_05635, partial [Thermoleophilaceae bacterium]
MKSRPRGVASARLAISLAIVAAVAALPSAAAAKWSKPQRLNSKTEAAYPALAGEGELLAYWPGGIRPGLAKTAPGFSPPLGAAQQD